MKVFAAALFTLAASAVKIEAMIQEKSDAEKLVGILDRLVGASHAGMDGNFEVAWFETHFALKDLRDLA